MNADNERLQNAFLNQLRKNGTPVTLFLMNGERLEGRIKSFDIYAISLDGPEPRLVVKTVIATILPSTKAARKSPAVKRSQSKPPELRVARGEPVLARTPADIERKAPEITRKKRRVAVR